MLNVKPIEAEYICDNCGKIEQAKLVKLEKFGDSWEKENFISLKDTKINGDFCSIECRDAFIDKRLEEIKAELKK
jgi:hypothetical protein